jgi:glycosyltransferase involved in cell wall biosynthesis
VPQAPSGLADVCVVVPAYNEQTTVREVVRELRAAFPLVVVIDDASRDATASRARDAGGTVLRHALNLGQGGALETGIQYGLSLPQVQRFVTFDADGQHDVADAVRMVQTLEAGDLDVVLGSRFLSPASAEELPGAKRVLLRAATFVNNRTSGVRLTDAHNGLRAFGRPFAELVRLTMLDMAHASELTMILARSGLRYGEVPVTVTYTEYSRSKGQRAVNAVNILFDITLSRLSGRPR